ncbi:hypothetical protein P9112_012284 [Eukaryota sp. TZLM1-RC]
MSHQHGNQPNLNSHTVRLPVTLPTPFHNTYPQSQHGAPNSQPGQHTPHQVSHVPMMTPSLLPGFPQNGHSPYVQSPYGAPTQPQQPHHYPSPYQQFPPTQFGSPYVHQTSLPSHLIPTTSPYSSHPTHPYHAQPLPQYPSQHLTTKPSPAKRGRPRGRPAKPKAEPKVIWKEEDELEEESPELESDVEFTVPLEERREVSSGRTRRTRKRKQTYKEVDSEDEFLDSISAVTKSLDRAGTEDLEDGDASPVVPEPVIDRILFHRVLPNCKEPFVCERRERLEMKNNDPLFIESPERFKRTLGEVESGEVELPEEFDLDILKQDFLLEFFVKWKGWSMKHATWQGADVIKSNRSGQVRLQRYLKHRRDEAEHLQGATDEEREDFLIKWELGLELIDEYTKVEMVLDKRKIPIDESFEVVNHLIEKDSSNQSHLIEYLVKWRELDEEDCTWEVCLTDNSGTIGFDEAIKEYEIIFSKPMDLKPFPALRQRIMYQFRGYANQPKWIKGGELRDYQLTGLNFLLTAWTQGRNVILADEMGLGKTIQSATFIGALRNDFKQGGPALVIVPLSTIHAWLKELRQWAPNVHVVLYYGSAKSRAVIRAHRLLSPTPDDYLFTEANSSSSIAIENPSAVNAEFLKSSLSTGCKPKFHVVLTTYELLLKDSDILRPFDFQLLIVDEAHRLKNDKSKLAEALDSFRVPTRVLITGTPLQNSLRELWNLLNFLDPVRFGDWNSFHVQFGDLSSDNQVSKLHEELQPYILRRLKKDVEKGIPGKIERIIRVELSPIQKRYYKWILTRNFDQLKKGSNITNLLNIMVELKKICNHPFLAMDQEIRSRILSEQGSLMSREAQLSSLVEASGKLMLLDRLLSKLFQRGSKVLVFSQMVRMLDILSEYLTFRNYKFQRLDGSMRSLDRKKAMDKFNAPDSEYFCFLLSTRAGGLGINLTAADVVVIFDSDWNPQNDLQAEARAHRIGQKKVVKIFRVVSKDSVEEEVLERAKKKLVLDHVVIQTMSQSSSVTVDPKKSSASMFDKSDINQILKFGAKELFTESDVDATSKVEERLRFNDDEIDRILNLEGDSLVEQEQSMSDAQQFLNRFEFSDFSSKPALEDQEEGANDANFWKNLIDQEVKEIPHVAELPRSRSRGPRVADYDAEDFDRPTEEVYYEPSDIEFEEPASRGRLVGGKIAQRDMKHIYRAFKTIPSFARISDITKISGIPKSEAVILRVCQELLQFCEDSVARTGKRADAIPTLTVEWRGVKSINAADLCRRVVDFENLTCFLNEYFTVDFIFNTPLNTEDAESVIVSKVDESTLSVPKPQWSESWSFIDDVKLAIATFRIGFSNWENIRKCPGLEKLDQVHIRAPMIARRVDLVLKHIGLYLNPNAVVPPPKQTKQVKKGSKSRRTRRKTEDFETPPIKQANTEPTSPVNHPLYSEPWCKDQLSSVQEDLERMAMRSSMGQDVSTEIIKRIGRGIAEAMSDPKYETYNDTMKATMRSRLWEYVSNFGNSSAEELREIAED